MEFNERNQAIVENWVHVNLKQDFVSELISLIVEFSKLFEKFDPSLTDKNLIIQNEGLILKSVKSGDMFSSVGWMTAFGSVIPKPGSKYTWAVKLVKKNRYCDWIYVG